MSKFLKHYKYRFLFCLGCIGFLFIRYGWCSGLIGICLTVISGLVLYQIEYKKKISARKED